MIKLCIVDVTLILKLILAMSMGTLASSAPQVIATTHPEFDHQHYLAPVVDQMMKLVPGLKMMEKFALNRSGFWRKKPATMSTTSKLVQLPEDAL